MTWTPDEELLAGDLPWELDLDTSLVAAVVKALLEAETPLLLAMAFRMDSARLVGVTFTDSCEADLEEVLVADAEVALVVVALVVVAVADRATNGLTVTLVFAVVIPPSEDAPGPDFFFVGGRSAGRTGLRWRFLDILEMRSDIVFPASLIPSAPVLLASIFFLLSVSMTSSSWATPTPLSSLVSELTRVSSLS